MNMTICHKKGINMKTSESITKIAPALLKVQEVIKNPEKGKTAKVITKGGGSYSYSYADLPSILDEARKLLTQNKIFLIQGHADSNGKLNIVTRFVHESGEWIEDEMLMSQFESGQMNSAQEMGSVSTYGRRYHLCAMLGIAGDEDTDTSEIGKNSASSTKASTNQGDLKQLAKDTKTVSTDQPGPIFCITHQVSMPAVNGKYGWFHSHSRISESGKPEYCRGAGFPGEQVRVEEVGPH